MTPLLQQQHQMLLHTRNHANELKKNISDNELQTIESVFVLLISFVSGDDGNVAELLTSLNN